jgi:hypothetical protein
MAIETETDAGSETDGRPVEPVDYMKLNAVYGALLAGVLLTTRERAREDPISTRELIPIGAATFALAKVVAKEKIGSWMRDPFVDAEKRPRGSRLQAAVGELVTCTRCVGAWSALTVVGVRMVDPPTGRTMTNVLAASAANDWLQSGFKWLCAQTNKTEAKAP